MVPDSSTSPGGGSTSRAQRLAALRLERQRGRVHAMRLDEKAASARRRSPDSELIQEARGLKELMHELRRKLREAARNGAGTDVLDELRASFDEARAAADAAADAAYPARFAADMYACWHDETHETSLDIGYLDWAFKIW